MDRLEQTWAEAMRLGRQGNTAAYERLLSEIAKRMRRLIQYRLSRLGLDIHQAEDLVQEVLIGLHTKRHTWDSNRPFLPWLHAIVRYKLTDAIRRLRREARYRCDLTLDEWSTQLQAPPEDFDRTVANVERRVSSLPAGQREVVQALAIEGASVRATAERLRTSEGAVRVMMHRALQRLALAADVGETKSNRGKI
jgi:RNA polymerase sigma-70 factor, ECF subfamily